MSQTHATSCCELIELLPGEPLTEGHRVETLVKSPAFEVKRLSLAKGKAIPTHSAAGEITVHCLRGRVAFTAGTDTHELEAGRLLYVKAGVPHSLVALENATVLVTKLAGSV